MRNFWIMGAAVCPHIKTDGKGSLIFTFSRLFTEGSIHNEKELGWREWFLWDSNFCQAGPALAEA